LRQLPKSKHEVLHWGITRIEEIDVEPKVLLRAGRGPIQMRCAKDKWPFPLKIELLHSH